MTATRERPIDSRCGERQSSDLWVVDVLPKRAECERCRKADPTTCRVIGRSPASSTWATSRRGRVTRHRTGSRYRSGTGPALVRHRSGTSDRFKACGPITSLRSRFLPRNETAFQCQSVFFVKCIGVFNCGRKRVFSTKWCFGPVIVCQSLSEGLEPTIH